LELGPSEEVLSLANLLLPEGGNISHLIPSALLLPFAHCRGDAVGGTHSQWVSKIMKLLGLSR
jgi:hypothetical protein